MARLVSPEWIAEHKHCGGTWQIYVPAVGPIGVYCQGCGLVLSISETWIDAKHGETKALQAKGRMRVG